MIIGIAAPIEVSSLLRHFPGINNNDINLGLGGTAINIIIDGLINAGHQVIVFTLDPNVKTKYVLEGQSLKIIIGNFRTSTTLKMLDFCRYETNQIRQFIESEKGNLDIVNAHWSYEFAVGTIRANVPHLITFRDDSVTILKMSKHPYRFMRLLMDYWVRRYGRAFSYNSDYLKSLIGLSGAIIPNPIKDSEITFARKYPDGKAKILICFIANGWDRRKNPEIAIQAFSKLIKSFNNLELHLIGHGFESGTDNYKKMLAAGLNDNIEYRGNMSHAQLMKELSNFDILLHTAREESFGNNIIEAMAKGIPVLGGQSSGAIPWVVGDSGLLVDIDDVNAVSAGLERLILDKSYYEHLSVMGIKNVVDRFSQSNISKQYLSQYSSIIKDN